MPKDEQQRQPSGGQGFMIDLTGLLGAAARHHMAEHIVDDAANEARKAIGTALLAEYNDLCTRAEATDVFLHNPPEPVTLDQAAQAYALNMLAARMAKRSVGYADDPDAMTAIKAQHHERLAALERWAGVVARLVDIESKLKEATGTGRPRADPRIPTN